MTPRAFHRSLAVFALCLAFFGVAFAAQAQEEKPKFIAPELSVPIPGLDFSKFPIIIENGKASLPFIGAYIAAVYRYLVGLSIVAAAVMIVYGGFQYIVGSSTAKIGRAKEIIRDAVIGLMLILGAYGILEVINPALLSPRAIDLAAVQRTAFQFSLRSAMTTKVVTGADTDEVAPSTPGVPGVPAPPPIQGAEAPSLSACPFSLENPLTLDPQGRSYLSTTKDPRTQEFYRKIKPLLTSESIVERISFVGDAAVNCQVHLGTCGQTAFFMWAAAEAIPESCLTDSTCQKLPGFGKYAYSVRDLPGSAANIRTSHCSTDCSRTTDCLPRAAAVAQAHSTVPGKVGGGYPQSWANDLQPGDWIYLYNGNKSCSGEHSIIFMGWEGEGLARTIQGPGIGTNPVEKKVCLTPKCGPYSLMTRIIRPKSLLSSGSGS